jgi:hypothetical protein
VREGTLAVWDTPQAGGLWSVQLTAVLADGKVLSAAIPLTIDNAPPVIRWIVPDTPKQLTVPKGGELILQVEVTDNLELEGVDFYWDGKVRTRLEIGPFSVRWSGLAAGRHLMKVCAQDRSGNGTCTLELEVTIGLKTSGGLTYNTPGKADT